MRKSPKKTPRAAVNPTRATGEKTAARKRGVKWVDPLTRDAEVGGMIRRDNARVERRQAAEGVRLRREAGEVVKFLGLRVGAPGDGRAMYRQIVDAVLCAAASGRIAERSPLPTLLGTATLLGVNLNTVGRAYRELHQAGVCDGGQRQHGVHLCAGGQATARGILLVRIANLRAEADRLRAAAGLS